MVVVVVVVVVVKEVSNMVVVYYVCVDVCLCVWPLTCHRDAIPRLKGVPLRPHNGGKRLADSNPWW